MKIFFIGGPSSYGMDCEEVLFDMNFHIMKGDE
jgi:hypothetical protein